MAASRKLEVIPNDFGIDLMQEQLTARCKHRGYQLFTESYVFDVKFDTSSPEQVGISARCSRSMKKNLDALRLNS